MARNLLFVVALLVVGFLGFQYGAHTTDNIHKELAAASNAEYERLRKEAVDECQADIDSFKHQLSVRAAELEAAQKATETAKAETAKAQEEINKLKAQLLTLKTEADSAKAADAQLKAAAVSEADAIKQQLLVTSNLLQECRQANRTGSTVTVPTQSSKESIQLHPPFVPSTTREVLDWEVFDQKSIYSWRRYWQIMKPIGSLQQEMSEAVEYARKFVPPSLSFVNGYLRTDPFRGNEYIVDFQHANDGRGESYQRVTVVRPFYPNLVKVADQKIGTDANLLHIIMPLTGRVDMFKLFMSVLAKEALQSHHMPIRLYIVYMCPEADMVNIKAMANISAVLQAYERSHKLSYRLMHLKQPFARGIGLEAGARSISESTAAMFFVDVDMYFNSRFLTRCRANQIMGKRAYFPIVFSLYRKKPRSVGQSNGAWRNYGLGMVCMFLSDFVEQGGYDKQITGWGREDVEFYERVSASKKIDVFRAPDPGLMHVFHEKICDSSTLTEDQFSDCMGSKADWEGTKQDLGKLLAKYELALIKANQTDLLNAIKA